MEVAFLVLVGIGMIGAGTVGIGRGRWIAGALAILGALSPWALYAFSELSGVCANDTSGFCMAYLVGMPTFVGLVVGAVAAIVCLVPKRNRPSRPRRMPRQIWNSR